MGFTLMEHYCDKRNVVEALSELLESTSGDAEGTLRVLDTDARIIAADDAEMEERNLWAAIERTEDIICAIEWRDGDLTTVFELKFHESSVTEPLEFMPAGHDAIGARQATPPTELGPLLGEALEPLEESGAMFTFAEVSAASMAHGGHYTDFEYEYSIDGLNL